MPRIISVNNHRFPGPDRSYAGPTAFEPGGQMISGWISPSPGILITPYPDSTAPNSPSSMYRYNLATNTTTTITIPGGGTRPSYDYSDRERPAYASLGGGYTQSLRIKDNIDGSATVTNWIWNDSAQTWSTGASLTIPSGYNQNKSNGLYALAVGKTLFEHGTQAWIYTRSTNSWAVVGTAMPREVWTAGKVAENILYLAGKEDEVTGVSYSAQSAQSFLFDAIAGTWTNLGHAIELAIPPTRDFGGTLAVQTRSGQMQQWRTNGVMGIGANSNWIVYDRSQGILFSRARSITPLNISALRSDPLSWAVNTATTDYVYSW